ncbi:MAG: hemerythrin domain-containing protein [Thermoanaerobaculia bacterium]
MDAISLLKDDHKTVKGLFKEFKSAGDRAVSKKNALFEQIRNELTVHAEVEEEIFYPAVKNARSEEAKDSVREAMEEHAIVKQLLEEIDELEPGDEQYGAKMKVLMESVEHHVEEEEDEMFSEARKALSATRLKELGADMKVRKESLKSQLAS